MRRRHRCRLSRHRREWRERRRHQAHAGPAREPRHRRMPHAQPPFHLPDRRVLPIPATPTNDMSRPAMPLPAAGLDQLLELAAPTDEWRLCLGSSGSNDWSQGAMCGPVSICPSAAACPPDGGDHVRGCPPRCVIHEDRSGAAAPWSRAAVFMMSPATIPWFSRPRTTATPGGDGRAGSGGLGSAAPRRLATAATISGGARRRGIVLAGHGRAPRRPPRHR